MNPYTVLRVRRNAGRQSIEKAFRRRAKETHPDRGGSAEAFAEAREAYRVLTDPDARAHFDRTGEILPPQQPSDHPVEVLKCLADVLSATVEAFAKTGRRVGEDDMVAQMVTVILAKNKELADEVVRLKKLRFHLEDCGERFVTDGPENYLTQMCVAQAGQIDTLLGRIAAAVDIHKEAVAFLKSYRFRHERPTTLSGLRMPGVFNTVGSTW